MSFFILRSSASLIRVKAARQQNKDVIPVDFNVPPRVNNLWRRLVSLHTLGSKLVDSRVSLSYLAVVDLHKICSSVTSYRRSTFSLILNGLFLLDVSTEKTESQGLNISFTVMPLVNLLFSSFHF